MKIAHALIGVVSVIGVTVAGTSAAYAVTINFDQNSGAASGDISYDGSGGALVGNDITFSFVSADNTPPNTPSLACNGCLLNFETGSFQGQSGKDYKFAGGGEFKLTGEVLDSGGSTVVDGDLLTGSFAGPHTFTESGVSDTSGRFDAEGFNDVANALASQFGIDPNADFLFLSSNISTGTLTFEEDGGFSGDVTAADLQTTPTNAVPEPRELGIFGLGFVLMIGGLLYRRRTGSDLG